MELTLKNYKILKTKNYIKTSDLFFFFNSINQNSTDGTKTEQELKKLNLSYSKIFNKTSKNLLKNSVYRNIEPLVNGLTVFIKSDSKNNKNLTISKKKLLSLESFVFLAIKMNKNIYSLNQVKYANSLKYRESKLLLYQFKLTNIKSHILNNLSK
uniref:Uncharacterized protein n=1 Tax=Fistulifera saprophila TaxID=880757 RepID=A0A8F0WGA1_9STRA|nr:hypothetical protein KYW68_mgp13 [Fistulifera saprophila]QWM93307.1 hypothetical protein [Fistulifera saprophila]